MLMYQKEFVKFLSYVNLLILLQLTILSQVFETPRKNEAADLAKMAADCCSSSQAGLVFFLPGIDNNEIYIYIIL